MNPRITKVKPLENYTLLLSFANGEKKIFDVKPFLEIGVFKALKDEKVFNAVRPFLGSIVWPDEIDLAPDRLYMDSKPVLLTAAEPRAVYHVGQKPKPHAVNKTKKKKRRT